MNFANIYHIYIYEKIAVEFLGQNKYIEGLDGVINIGNNLDRPIVRRRGGPV